jgi:hypothetical protein
MEVMTTLSLALTLLGNPIRADIRCHPGAILERIATKMPDYTSKTGWINLDNLVKFHNLLNTKGKSLIEQLNLELVKINEVPFSDNISSESHLEDYEGFKAIIVEATKDTARHECLEKGAILPFLRSARSTKQLEHLLAGVGINETFLSHTLTQEGIMVGDLPALHTLFEGSVTYETLKGGVNLMFNAEKEAFIVPNTDAHQTVCLQPIPYYEQSESKNLLVSKSLNNFKQDTTNLIALFEQGSVYFKELPLGIQEAGDECQKIATSHLFDRVGRVLDLYHNSDNWDIFDHRDVDLLLDGANAAHSMLDIVVFERNRFTVAEPKGTLTVYPFEKHGTCVKGRIEYRANNNEIAVYRIFPLLITGSPYIVSAELFATGPSGEYTFNPQIEHSRLEQSKAAPTQKNELCAKALVSGTHMHASCPVKVARGHKVYDTMCDGRYRRIMVAAESSDVKLDCAGKPVAKKQIPVGTYNIDPSCGVVIDGHTIAEPFFDVEIPHLAKVPGFDFDLFKDQTDSDWNFTNFANTALGAATLTGVPLSTLFCLACMGGICGFTWWSRKLKLKTNTTVRRFKIEQKQGNWWPTFKNTHLLRKGEEEEELKSLGDKLVDGQKGIEIPTAPNLKSAPNLENFDESRYLTLTPAQMTVVQRLTLNGDVRVSTEMVGSECYMILTEVSKPHDTSGAD